MERMTKYFGELSFKDDEVLDFKNGLFGFEKYRYFSLIRFDNDNGNILCLQSLEESELAFPVINPFSFLSDYTPKLNKESLEVLKLNNEKEALFYNICVMRPVLKNSTVNLRCPIVVNPETRDACQVILDNTQYSFKYPFSSMIKEG